MTEKDLQELKVKFDNMQSELNDVKNILKGLEKKSQEILAVLTSRVSTEPEPELLVQPEIG